MNLCTLFLYNHPNCLTLMFICSSICTRNSRGLNTSTTSQVLFVIMTCTTVGGGASKSNRRGTIDDVDRV